MIPRPVDRNGAAVIEYPALVQHRQQRSELFKAASEALGDPGFRNRMTTAFNQGFNALDMPFR